MTYRELRDKLNTLTDEQLNQEIKWSHEPYSDPWGKSAEVRVLENNECYYQDTEQMEIVGDDYVADSDDILLKRGTVVLELE